MMAAVRRSIGVVALALAVLLSSLVVAFGYFMVAGDDFHRRLAGQLIGEIFDKRVSLVGTFSFDVGLEPTFVATGIRIENPPWAGDPELGRVDRLEVQVSLVPLLSGVILVPHLFLEGVRLALEVNAEGESNWGPAVGEEKTQRSQDRRDPFIPLFDSVTVRNLAVIYTDRRSGQSTTIYLDSYTQRKRTADAGFDIVGNGRVNDDDFRIGGRVGSLETALTAKEPYAFDISFDMLGLAVGLEGTATNAPRGEGLAVRLNASAPSLTRVLDILDVESPVDARLDLSARLSGDLDSLSMSDLVLDIGGRAGQRFHAEGSVADVVMGRGLSVTFTGALLSNPTLARRLPEFVRDIEKLELQGRVTGSLEAPAVEDLRIRLAALGGSELVLDGRLGFDVTGERAKLAALELTASLLLPSLKPIERLSGAELPDVGPLDAKAVFYLAGDRIAVESFEVGFERFEGLRLTGRGKLARISQDTLDAWIEAELDLSVSIKDLRTLEALTVSDLPPIGPITIATRLSLDEDGYLLDDIRIRAGSKSAVWAEAKAKLGPLRFDEGDLLRFLSGDVVVEWASAAALGRLLNEDIPDVGPGTGRFRIVGRPQGVRISNLRIETGVPDGVTVVAMGEIQALAFSPKLAMRGVSLDVEADSKTTEPVSRLIGLGLPELGPVRLRARFIGRDGVVVVPRLDLLVGQKGRISLRAKGTLADPLSLKGLRLTGEFDADVARILKVKAPEDETGLGVVHGTFEISDADGSLGIELLKAELTRTDALSVSANGRFDDLNNLDEIEFQVSFSVPSPRSLARVFGLEVAEVRQVTFEGRVAGDDEKWRAEGDVYVGQTRLSARLSGSLAGGRPSIKGRIFSPLIRTADFGFALSAAPPDDEKTTREGRNNAPSSRQYLFADDPINLARLRDLDLDLEVLVEEVDGVRFNIDKIEGRIELSSGLLKIDRMRFDLIGGSVRMKARVDTRASMPALMLHVSAQDLDLGDFIAKTQLDIPIDGDLDLVVNLTASGDSPRALAATLDGEFGLSMSRGRIRSSRVELAALDIMSWMFSGSAVGDSTKIDCYLVQLDFKNGRGDFRTLVLDTPNVRTLGSGYIDLRNEWIEIKIDPKAKKERFVKFTTRASIEGPLSNPSIKTSGLGAAGRLVGEIALAPSYILGSLLPFINDEGKDMDNPCLKLK